MKKDIIKSQLDKAGRTVYLKDGEWRSVPFKACVSHLWRKKTSAFEPEYAQLGRSFSEYYLYIGPYGHDITSLSGDAVLELDGENYAFKHADAVFFGGEVIYYTGILKRIKGADWDEN